MKIIGIIVEYNPLHNGHVQHLQKSRQLCGFAEDSDAVVAVISGNFVQRGEPAICDKWLRTKMALLAGVDLVLELPLFYATASAEIFAKGATTILDACGLVDNICFGSELADISALTQYAKISLLEVAENLGEKSAEILGENFCGKSEENFSAKKNPDNFAEVIKSYLHKGFSYPVAKTKTIEKFLAADFPVAPNNVLGVEYVKSLLQLNSGVVPLTVPRSAGSAKILRDCLKNHENHENHENISIAEKMPLFAWNLLNDSINNYGLARLDNLSQILHYILQTSPPKHLAEILDISEGLENRLIECATQNFLISEIIAAAKTKRYSYLRLQRAILHIILGIKKGYTPPQYIRVLGFNSEKAYLLGLLQKRAKLPVVLNLPNAAKSHKLGNFSQQANKMLQAEITASKVYGLSFDKNRWINEFAFALVKK